jgi:hypothetical protein
MNNHDLVMPVILLTFIALREWQQQRLVNKLIDKLMSRNYYDYKVSGAIVDINKRDAEDVKTRQRLQTISEQQELQQELGSMSGLVG